jgi:hypothetical protein
VSASQFTNKKSRLRILGGILIFMALFSFLLGVGMPGVGWALAMLVLLALNVIARVLGPGFLWVGLGISVLHLLTVGPFPIVSRSVSRMDVPPLWFIVVLIVLPYVLSVATIARQWRRSPV